MQASDLMTTDVATVSPDDEVSEVLGQLARVDYNGFPVVDDDGDLVGIVTEGDLVRLFETEDRVIWIPIGFPPFLDTVTYGVDVSWADLDLGVDLVRHAGRPIREVMTADVVTVGPDADLNTLIDVLGDAERNINRLPVVEEGALVGIVTRQDVLSALRADRLGA
jgi:CBS domain-containing protein